MKKLIVFDLDGTLAESKSALDPEMAAALRGLLRVAKVAVISGGDWPQFEKQLLAGLSADAKLADLLLLPTCGTKYYRHDGAWKKLYSEDFAPEEKARIIAAFKSTLAQSGLEPERVWGEVIEDRGSQITFSALGQQAPVDAKRSWDPDFSRRQKLKAALEVVIPGFSIRLGGMTSVDVTRQGIDKAYGIRKLEQFLGISVAEMIFVGDAIFPGGNDYPAKEAGVACIQVRDPAETKRVIEAITLCLG